MFFFDLWLRLSFFVICSISSFNRLYQVSRESTIGFARGISVWSRFEMQLIDAFCHLRVSLCPLNELWVREKTSFDMVTSDTGCWQNARWDKSLVYFSLASGSGCGCLVRLRSLSIRLSTLYVLSLKSSRTFGWDTTCSTSCSLSAPCSFSREAFKYSGRLVLTGSNPDNVSFA